MPYVPKEDRSQALLTARNVGELTFQIQQLLDDYLIIHGLRYQQIAEITGALHQAERDFNERVVRPYETQAKLRNGDVWHESLLNGGRRESA